MKSEINLIFLKYFFTNYLSKQFDKKFEKKNPNFVFYDFKHPEDIPEKFTDFFDFVVIDPPFITRDVWELVKKKNCYFFI